MKLFQKMRAVFQPKSEPAPVVPTGYSDEDFLDVVMEQARRRTRAEQAGGANAPASGALPGPLTQAA